jgi:hypothetical protein
MRMRWRGRRRRSVSSFRDLKSAVLKIRESERANATEGRDLARPIQTQRLNQAEYGSRQQMAEKIVELVQTKDGRAAG